jgi:hypothetical protein
MLKEWGSFLAGFLLVVWACNTVPRKSPRPIPATSIPIRTYLSIFEMESGEFLMANVEIVAEETDGRGHYNFYRPDGSVHCLDLSEGAWRIIREKRSLT